ncbi:MAG: nuclease [Cyanobium sp.]
MALQLSASLVYLVLPVDAAEVLQVAGADRLIIGDRNRSAEVILGCMAVTPGSELEATTWLRQRLPRRSRVILRPVGERDNRLIARIAPMDGAETGDLSDGLVTAGLASSTPCSS